MDEEEGKAELIEVEVSTSKASIAKMAFGMSFGVWEDRCQRILEDEQTFDDIQAATVDVSAAAFKFISLNSAQWKNRVKKTLNDL